MGVLRDQQGVILSWFVRIILGMAIVGVILFDAGSIALNYFGVDSAADEIAVLASTQVGDGTLTTQQEIEEYTQALADERGAKVVSVEVDPEGVLHVRLKRKAKTLIVSRVGFMKKWARATGQGSANAQ